MKCCLFKVKEFDPSCLHFQLGFHIVEINDNKLFLIKEGEHLFSQIHF